MRIRLGHVSNSSSSSFVVRGEPVGWEEAAASASEGSPKWPVMAVHRKGGMAGDFAFYLTPRRAGMVEEAGMQGSLECIGNAVDYGVMDEVFVVDEKALGVRHWFVDRDFDSPLDESDDDPEFGFWIERRGRSARTRALERGKPVFAPVDDDFSGGRKVRLARLLGQGELDSLRPGVPVHGLVNAGSSMFCFPMDWDMLRLFLRRFGEDRECAYLIGEPEDVPDGHLFGRPGAYVWWRKEMEKSLSGSGEILLNWGGTPEAYNARMWKGRKFVLPDLPEDKFEHPDPVDFLGRDFGGKNEGGRQA